MSQKHENLNFEIYEENVIFASVFKVCIFSTIKYQKSNPQISSSLMKMIYWCRGGQTAAREPQAILRAFACGSLCFPKNCIFFLFFSIANCRNIVKCYCGSCRAVQYCVCKSFQKELMSQNILQINPCF